MKEPSPEALEAADEMVSMQFEHQFLPMGSDDGVFAINGPREKVVHVLAQWLDKHAERMLEKVTIAPVKSVTMVTKRFKGVVRPYQPWIGRKTKKGDWEWWLVEIVTHQDGTSPVPVAKGQADDATTATRELHMAAQGRSLWIVSERALNNGGHKWTFEREDAE